MKYEYSFTPQNAQINCRVVECVFHDRRGACRHIAPHIEVFPSQLKDKTQAWCSDYTPHDGNEYMLCAALQRYDIDGGEEEE